MHKITFVSVENGYTSRAEADKYNICYTVMMKDTDTNNIITLIEYAVAFLLIAGIPEKEISITLSQGEVLAIQHDNSRNTSGSNRI